MEASACQDYSGFFGNPLSDALPITQRETVSNQAGVLVSIDHYTDFNKGQSETAASIKLNGWVAYFEATDPVTGAISTEEL